MYSQSRIIAAAWLASVAWADVYYPPFLTPKAGDTLTANTGDSCE